MQDNFLSSPFFYSLALTLIHFLWQGVLVSAVLKLALMFTSHKKSQLRYGYSTVAMLVNLLLPFITFFILYKPDYLPFSGQEALTATIDSASKMSVIQQNFWHSNIAEYLPYLAMAWLTVVTILSSKLLIELYTVNQLPRHNTVPADAKLTARFNTLITQLGLTNRPRLVISLKTNVPIAIGWLKPVVLIPVSMLTGLTPNQLDMLILHELAHIRRHDYLVNFIQTLVEILLFFHPSVLWVSNQMRNEREYCSDDIAVKSCGDPIAYAHTLADTASLCHKHRNRSIPSMAMAASGGDLKQRVMRLIDHHHCTNDNNASKWLASMVIVLSIAILATKQFVELPHIDFSSGNISLYRSTSDVTFQYGTAKNIPDISKNSIAQQLLGENKKDEKTKELLHRSNNLEKVILPVISSQKKLENTVQSLALETTKTQNIIKERLKAVPTKRFLADQEFENKLTLASTRTSNKKQIEIPVTHNKQSSATRAFTRTDLNTQLKNPYANQVASLLNEPTLNNTHDIVEKNNVTTFPNSQKILPVTSPKILTIKKTAAKLITSYEPKYPSSAKRKGIELEVLVDFSIDKNGRVKDINFKSKSKLSYFRSTIRNAMEKWRFKPAQINGKAVESEMSKIFSFSLLR